MLKVFDCLYKDNPCLFELVTEEFEDQMKFKQ